MSKIAIADIVWDPSVYPRQRWNTATIERYADAIIAGEEFPPVVLEAETNRLLDGKHRLEAHKKAGVTDIPATWVTVPDNMSVKYFAATLSARHGDRLCNADIKSLAEIEFEADPTIDPTKWGRGLGVSKSSVYRWVSHILERERTSRGSKAWRLARLGWTQEEIATHLDVTQGLISQDIKNSHLGKINTLKEEL